jgi:hypothetical protein
MLCFEAQARKSQFAFVPHTANKGYCFDRAKILGESLARGNDGDVPDEAWHEMTVGARHRFSALDRAFRYQKAASKEHISRLILEI